MEPKKLRFIDSRYNQLFTINDGEEIVLELENGDTLFLVPGFISACLINMTEVQNGKPLFFCIVSDKTIPCRTF
jgi:hypothetical protein